MRKLAVASIAFSAAVISAVYLPVGQWIYWCAGLLLVTSFLGLLFKQSVRLRFFIVLPALSIGLLWTSAYHQLFVTPALSLDGKTATVTADVINVGTKTDNGEKLTVRLKTGVSRPVKAVLYIYGELPETLPGNKISFTAKFRSSSEIYGEKTTSYYDDGIYLLAQAQGTILVIDRASPLTYLPQRIAIAASGIISKIYPTDTSGFMKALLLGDTTSLYSDHTFSAALRATGTTHIVAVSGMNLAFLTGLLAIFIRNKRLLSSIAIPVILLFMAVVGFTPSVTRAGIMQLFFLIAPLLRRESDTLTSLSASLLVILFTNPYAGTNAGLHLSFSATLGILLFTERLFNVFDTRIKKMGAYQQRYLRIIIRFVIANVATTIGALIFTVPIIALHFGTVSLITLIANLLVLPIVTLAFYAGTFSVALGFLIPALGTLGVIVASPSIHLIDRLIRLLANIPFASVSTENTGIVIWLVFVYLIIIVLLTRKVRLRNVLIPLCSSTSLLCIILLLTSLFGTHTKFSVTALDVGQGQCVVIESGAFTAVVDCGSTGKNAGAILEGFLERTGRLRIDLLILTHYHEDHADGVPDILNSIPVSAIAVPDPSIDNSTLKNDILSTVSNKGIKLISVTENFTVRADTCNLRLFAPLGSTDENERGLSILCSEDNFDVLITGDMRASIERRLLNENTLPDIEALIVGHHGSKYSTSDELLSTLQPDVAVISVGYNTYGHPAEETLRKLKSTGISVYRTDLSGNVTIQKP